MSEVFGRSPELPEAAAKASESNLVNPSQTNWVKHDASPSTECEGLTPQIGGSLSAEFLNFMAGSNKQKRR